ncbi:MAG: serine protease [Myxococcota bacterium]
MSRLLAGAIVVLVLLVPQRSAVAAKPSTIKKNVVIVRPRFEEKTRETFAAMAKRYEAAAEEALALRGTDRRITDAQLEQLAQTFRAHAARAQAYSGSPSHGSGWVWRPKRGKTAYIVTNEHVAGQAVAVSVKFGRRSDQAPIEGEVIYVAREVDLAVVAVNSADLPSTATGLSLTEAALEEGDTVFASGFPGTDTRVGMIPSYSLTDGIISNADLDDDSGSGTTLAHTATVDPGNSGGPLLSRSRSGSFLVVGMNTSIDRRRRNVNYAIPASTIRDELSKALESVAIRARPERMKAALESTAGRLAIELGSASPNIQFLEEKISYAFVGERPDTLTAPIEMGLQGQIDESVFKVAITQPVKLARGLLLGELIKHFGSDAGSVGGVSFVSLTDTTSVATGGPVRSIFDVRGERREITWKWEHGAWRIAYIALPRNPPPPATQPTAGPSAAPARSGSSAVATEPQTEAPAKDPDDEPALLVGGGVAFTNNSDVRVRADVRFRLGQPFPGKPLPALTLNLNAFASVRDSGSYVADLDLQVRVLKLKPAEIYLLGGVGVARFDIFNDYRLNLGGGTTFGRAGALRFFAEGKYAIRVSGVLGSEAVVSVGALYRL